MSTKNRNAEIKIADLYAFCTRNFPEESFWEENHQLKDYEPYKSLIKQEGKDKSSKIMDAIWTIYDGKAPVNHLKENGSAEEKELKEQTAFVIFGDKDFPWDDYDWVIEPFKKHVLTVAESNALFYKEKIDIFREHINRLTVETDPREMASLMDEYDKMESKYIKKLKDIDKERASQGTFRKGTILHWVEVV